MNLSRPRCSGCGGGSGTRWRQLAVLDQSAKPSSTTPVVHETCILAKSQCVYRAIETVPRSSAAGTVLAVIWSPVVLGRCFTKGAASGVTRSTSLRSSRH